MTGTPEPSGSQTREAAAREVLADHKCFTAESTAYLRNLDDEDLRGEAIAVYYQKAPEQTERGTSISLNFPLLLVTGYAA